MNIILFCAVVGCALITTGTFAHIAEKIRTGGVVLNEAVYDMKNEIDVLKNETYASRDYIFQCFYDLTELIKSNDSE